ncbi:DDE-type integrase/transposase/recombinase [Pseudoalteromonas shioyasakiensis]|uniref:DDE-type integrase/transposase/recombinase n=2 Tax=Pseudoalteromonas shioyasakiensis TaxID=1190813 RepID=A0ABT6U3P1_9GAMM|nr:MULTISPECIES: DDE-type integrase/transposase/recombinase [Pseudoalteromonas]MDI4670741.1 DDE-type integrase/transposase/recombinase [Pseudoalteromonas shioyasakiensis]MDI4674140.1 DDE-type integrase/transposase/recombinase [Pseudoalteromonas shioyasakiensis]NUJ23751.1 transposase family protein [Pseudoalteromonas sp. 0802]NUJ36271.1 transposase family protein [Pseudoalteromonas sp. 1701]
MGALIKQGTKFRMDNSSYLVRSVAREHLDNMIFYSLFDDDSQKVNNARVECMTQPELYKKIIENEAVIYERASDIPMQQLLTENQLNQMSMWQAFFDLHFEKHYKNFTAKHNVDETIEAFNWSSYNSRKYSRSSCQAKIKVYRDSGGDIRSVIGFGYHEKKNSKRLTAATEDLIYEYFCDYYLVRSDATAKSVHAIADMLRAKIRELSKSKPACYPIIPCVDTIYRRFRETLALLTTQKTLSKAEAKKLRYKLGREFVPEDPLERVEMDAVYINQGLNNDANKFLGTIVMMIAIDTCTRCPLGYSIRVGKNASESADLAVECLKSVVTPKDNPLWPCFGVPVKLVNDATTATKGNIFKSLALQLGANSITTRSGEGQSKPFIESFFRTLRREFLSKLPGYLGSKTRVNNSHLEATEDAELHASMTLEEFVAAFEDYITNVYMQSAHSGLKNRAPVDVWMNAISKNPLLQTVPENAELSEFRGCYRAKCKLYGNGSIKLKNEQYVSDELKALGLAGVESVECFYSDIDTSSVVVKHQNDTFIVPIREMNHHDDAGVQQAELDAARNAQFSECDVVERKHYEYKSGSKRGLPNFKKAKQKQAEKREIETGRKQPARTKYNNDKAIDVDSVDAREQILRSLNAQVAVDEDFDTGATFDDFEPGGEL